MDSRNIEKMQNAAFVFARSVAAMAHIEAMKAENKNRGIKGDSLAYSEIDFFNVLDECGLHHNDVVLRLSQGTMKLKG